MHNLREWRSDAQAETVAESLARQPEVEQQTEIVHHQVLAVSVVQDNDKKSTKPTYVRDATEPTFNDGAERHIVNDVESFAQVHSDGVSDSSYNQAVIV